MKPYLAIYSSLLVLLFLSCDSRTVFDKNENIPHRQWLKSDSKSFDVHVEDISKPYNIYLSLRHTTDYPYATINLLLQQVRPNKERVSITRSIKLAQADGKWTGTSAGSLYAQQVLIHENYHFTDTGHYNFSIQQLMRDNPLKEIVDVGILIQRN